MKTKLLLISLLCIGLLSCEKDSKRENDKNSSNNQENVNGEEGENGSSDENDSSYIKNGALPGVFSVSDTKQVKFSQGNLQYQASTNTWRFAENQYDYVGIGNQNISNTYSGWIDLFGWGTGDNPTNVSEDNEDYPTFVDWGVNNAISNGGNEKGMWRTLTSDEWNYLFEVRDRASALWGQATINDGFKGLVILPDNWKDTNASFVRGYGNGYDTNKFTFQEWSVMESYGAVFLPAAGNRNGASMYSVGTYGHYWSSTYYSNDDTYQVYFGSGRLLPSNNHGRHYGHSVRLCSEISSK